MQKCINFAEIPSQDRFGRYIICDKLTLVRNHYNEKQWPYAKLIQHTIILYIHSVSSHSNRNYIYFITDF